MTTKTSRWLTIVGVLLLSGARADAAGPEPTPPPTVVADGTWTFVVGGDSRNCGDVIMPAVAAGATSAGAKFYWHLGDFRALYDFDQDLLAERRTAGVTATLSISDYQKTAWDDFILNQIGPFGTMPVFLGIGNHELVAPKSRLEYLAQFADWLSAAPIKAQRLQDNPNDRKLKTYYHWTEDGVDFLTLDNASDDQFDSAQVAWLQRVIRRDSSDSSVTTIVAGMHIPLPDSLSPEHSMSNWAQGEESGRKVYAALLKAQAAGKKVYVLSSHSHFYMSGIYDTPYWRAHGGVLPGWIIGTTGAIRYALPPGAAHAKESKTNTYGYLVGTVDAKGAIRFDFHEIKEEDIPAAVVTRFTKDFVHQCFIGNIRQEEPRR